MEIKWPQQVINTRGGAINIDPHPSLLMGVSHQSDIAELILDTLFQWGGDGCFNVFLYFQLTQELRNPIYFFIYLYFLRAGPRGEGGGSELLFYLF